MSGRRTSHSDRLDNETAKDADPVESDEAMEDSAVTEDVEAIEEDVSPADADDAIPAEDDARALKDRWLRAEADLQNFRRRATREREESRRAAEESVVMDVISVMDDLDRAIAAARDADVEAAWIQGFELVATRLRDTLSKRGVDQMDPIGTPFNPEFHEALLEMDVPEGSKPGDVVQVVLKGYTRDGRALRAARVVVARAPVEDA